MWSGVVVEKNWAYSVDQCRMQALQFSVHLIFLLSILLSCNGFAGIQKAVVDQTSSRPPVTMTFFWCKFGCGKCFGVSWSNHRAAHHRSSYKIHFSLHVTNQLKHGSLLFCQIRENDTSKQWSFWFFIQLMRHPLLIFFTFPIYFKGQMTSMNNIEFFNNFLCSYKRISFYDCSQLSTSDH